MAEKIVNRAMENVSDEAVEKATGRTWAGWFALLDEAGAAEWKHAAIARRLHDEHGVDGWWAQGITVAYEQARGIRLPGQRQDGSFEVSASKTLPAGQQGALDAVIDAVSTDLGADPESVSRDVTYMTARWRLEGRESLLATAQPSRGDKTSVALTHSRLETSEALAPAKARMQGWLKAAAERLG